MQIYFEILAIKDPEDQTHEGVLAADIDRVDDEGPVDR